MVGRKRYISPEQMILLDSLIELGVTVSSLSRHTGLARGTIDNFRQRYRTYEGVPRTEVMHPTVQELLDELHNWFPKEKK